MIVAFFLELSLAISIKRITFLASSAVTGRGPLPSSAVARRL